MTGTWRRSSRSRRRSCSPGAHGRVGVSSVTSVLDCKGQPRIQRATPKRPPYQPRAAVQGSHLHRRGWRGRIRVKPSFVSSPSSSPPVVGHCLGLGDFHRTPARVTLRVTARPARDIVVARLAPTVSALPPPASVCDARRPARRLVHALGHPGPGHLNVLAQTRAGALHPVLVVGPIARLADWRDDATDSRHPHVTAHIGLVAATFEGAPPSLPPGRFLGVADPRSALGQCVRASVDIPRTKSLVQDQDL